MYGRVEGGERLRAAGVSYDSLLPFRKDELSRAWQEHGVQLLAAWIAEHPGTRPHAWYEWDLPFKAQRRKVAGSGIESCVLWDHHRLWAYYDVTPGDPPKVESEAAFLKRLRKLVPGEEKRIPAKAWEPIVFPEPHPKDPERWSPSDWDGWDTADPELESVH